MKINNKTIVVIIIVAVVAYLLWKKSKENAIVYVGASSGTTAEPDHTSLDYILTHIDFNSTERAKIESYKAAAEANNTLRQSVQAKAFTNGLSYDQQLVCEALWVLYHGTSNWSTRGWGLTEKVKSL